MEPIQILFLILIFVFVCMSFFFSITETAFSSMNKYRMTVLADDGSKSARLCLWLVKRFDSTLIAVLIGNNAVNVLMSFVSTYLFLAWMPSSIDETWSSLIATVVTTLFLYVFGETLPKQIGKKIPNKVARITCYPLVVIFIVLFPLTLLFLGISNAAKFLSGNKEEPELTEEDFNAVIEDNEDAGVLEENETDIIQNTFDFADTSVKEILTPVEKMFMIDLKGLSNDQLVDKLMRTNHSRIPVYYSDPNKVIGILLVKNYLSLYLKDHHVNVREVLVKPYVVSPNIMMNDMVEGFRNKHTQIALVYKENRLLGMITTEDVLEELVGPLSERATKGA